MRPAKLGCERPRRAPQNRSRPASHRQLGIKPCSRPVRFGSKTQSKAEARRPIGIGGWPYFVQGWLIHQSSPRKTPIRSANEWGQGGGGRPGMGDPRGTASLLRTCGESWRRRSYTRNFCGAERAHTRLWPARPLNHTNTGLEICNNSIAPPSPALPNALVISRPDQHAFSRRSSLGAIASERGR